MSGTRWTAPGEGDAIITILRTVNLYIKRSEAREIAKDRLFKLSKAIDYRTNLALTGEPLTAEDIQRIAEAK